MNKKELVDYIVDNSKGKLLELIGYFYLEDSFYELPSIGDEIEMNSLKDSILIRAKKKELKELYKLVQKNQ